MKGAIASVQDKRKIVDGSGNHPHKQWIALQEGSPITYAKIILMGSSLWTARTQRMQISQTDSEKK